MAPRRQCPVCHSKHWHKEPSSGLITCSEGHVLQNYRNETTEVTELGPHAVRKRTIKSGRKKKGRQSKVDPKLYHGDRARYHYFQCLQLILRMQVASLTRLWSLPPEYEKVCRDIWALNLSLLPNPPVAEPLLCKQDREDIDVPSKNELTSDKHRSDAGESDGEQSDGNVTSRSSASDPSSSLQADDSDRDSELEELMKDNSDSPSSDDGEEPGQKRKHRASVPITKKKPMFGYYDTPATTVAVLVVACWTLRFPLMYMDFVRLIESYDLPYLDALRLIPENMTRYLRTSTVSALSPYNAPSPLRLHRLASRLARLMYSSHDIHTPEMNAAPILWKAVRTLQGTPTLYVLTKRLAKLVSIPLTLHRYLAPPLPRTKERDPVFHQQDSAVPEVALIAAVIVVMKMVYGLDGQSRRPRDKNDPSCALPTLPELLIAVKAADDSDSAHIPASSWGTKRSALDMDGAMMDEYLAFCEKALLPRADRMPARNATTDQFPIRETPIAARGNANDDRAWPKLTANRIYEGDENVLKPGEQYVIYDTQDILGSLPDDMELIVSRAARWAGVDEGYVAGVVERFERRIVRWWENVGVRRKARGEQTDTPE